ncbi:adenylosuccinate lyase (plasmid) [Methylocystis iwaonis]|uniref:Adenylosuccinate lyase n=2 Tax=Methylocystis iwaonis TaxID=2885079 RepID=A0ABN6VMJ9_9HYPH|nr:adenylosuccinate lyase [Methylocystis iwaonis]
MDAHMIDSKIFGHRWSTPESHEIFGETARVARWLEVIVTLAEAQAECGIIPVAAAEDIGALRGAELPLDRIAERTRSTGHSTLGMIQTLRELLPATSSEYVYFGATVQDVSDTAQVLEMKAGGALLWRDLWMLEGALIELARQHRETPMAGRTHGQLGAPISFGFKLASWADEIGRHLERMRGARSRWLVGQLGGAVGALAFFGNRGLDLRAAFCRRLSLREPAISWLSCRDRIAEFAHVAAMAATSLARIANEIYVLQRSEIGELRERSQNATVGSITMPHKRNPERSEQIVTLAQLARAQSNILTDSLVHEHERDGRHWKIEWSVFPTLCHSVLAAAAMSRELVCGLEIDMAAMRRNLSNVPASEHLLSVMSARLGKHRAQMLLQEAYRAGAEEKVSLTSLLQGFATQHELSGLARVDFGSCALMVDRVVEAAGRRRALESECWQ